MKIIDFLPRQHDITVAISGLNKNAGKTVVLNKLIDDAVAIGKTIALTSIGYDGEKTDMLDGHQKPQIYVTSGTIVATATSLIEKSKLDIEILQATDQYTPLGEVYIVRFRQNGFTEIVGPSSLKGLIKVNNVMRKLADIVIVDGALNRISQMSPKLCDAAFFAVGGKGTISELVEKTKYHLSLFNLPLIPEHIRSKALCIIRSNKCALISTNNKLIELSCDEILSQKNKKDYYVVYSGALTYAVLKSLQTLYKGVIVPDISTIFVPPKLIKNLFKKGFEIYVGWHMPLISITLNPMNMAQQSLSILELGAKISSLCPKLPVVDVITSLHFQGGELVGRLE